MSVNDSYASRFIFTMGATQNHPFDLTGATSESGEPAALPSLWYEFTPTTSDYFVIQALLGDGTSGELAWNVTLALWTGPDLAGLTLVRTNNAILRMDDLVVGTRYSVAVYDSTFDPAATTSGVLQLGTALAASSGAITLLTGTEQPGVWDSVTVVGGSNAVSDSNPATYVEFTHDTVQRGYVLRSGAFWYPSIVGVTAVRSQVSYDNSTPSTPVSAGFFSSGAITVGTALTTQGVHLASQSATGSEVPQDLLIKQIRTYPPGPLAMGISVAGYTIAATDLQWPPGYDPGFGPVGEGGPGEGEYLRILEATIALDYLVFQGLPNVVPPEPGSWSVGSIGWTAIVPAPSSGTQVVEVDCDLSIDTFAGGGFTDAADDVMLSMPALPAGAVVTAVRVEFHMTEGTNAAQWATYMDDVIFGGSFTRADSSAGYLADSGGYVAILASSPAGLTGTVFRASPSQSRTGGVSNHVHYDRYRVERDWMIP